MSFGDLLAAIEDCVDGSSPDEVGQAPEHAVGALVEILALTGEGAGFVPMQAERLLECDDESAPVFALRGAAVGERVGGNSGEAAGDLAAADAGKQACMFDVDSGVDECRRDALGEVFQLIGDLCTRSGGQRNVVDLIDEDQIAADVAEDRADGISDVGEIGAARDRETEEPREFDRDHARSRSRGGKVM